MSEDKNQFEYLPIDVSDEKHPNVTSTTIRMSVDVPYELSEKIKDIAYSTGDTQAEIILKAMGEFVKDKTIKSRPESLKLREKSRARRNKK